MAVHLDIPGLFDRVGYEPHPLQLDAHAAMQDHRFRVAAAGRRFGKSQIGGHDLTVAAMRAHAMRGQLEPKGRRHEYWIVGPEYSDAEKEFRVFYNDMLRLGAEFDHPGTYYDANGGNMNVSMFGGRFLVSAKSAKYPGTLVGEGLQGVILAEAAKLKEVVWTKFIRPTLADYAREGSWALMSSTPEGKNWFYRQYMRGLSTDPADSEWYGLRAPSWKNPVVFPLGKDDPEIMELRRDMTKEKFKQEIGAEFTEFVGRVFKDFSEETHVRRIPYDPSLPVFLALDKGFRAPSVVLFLQMDVFDNVYVIAEYYQPDRTAEEIAQDVLEDPKLGPLVRVARVGYPDPASPEWSATLEKAWSVKMMGGTGGELQPRLDLIRRWLRPAPYELEDGHPEKIPKLLFDQDCFQTIREFNDYRYPETRDEQKTDPSENPMKKDDHTPEAIGRFFIGHLRNQFQESSTSRVSKASMRARR